MQQLNCKCFLIIFALIFYKKFVKSEAEWAIAEDGNKYLIENKYQYTWLEALQECNKRNLSLVTIDTAEKNFYLVNILKNRFGLGLDLWIGATASTAENSQRKFVWTTNGKSFNFANWESGEPNNLGGDQPCVHMWSKTNNFTWADGQWHLKYGYICEENLITNYNEQIAKKRQAIRTVIDKLNLYFKKKQIHTDQSSQAEDNQPKQMTNELEDKLEITKQLIDRILLEEI